MDEKYLQYRLAKKAEHRPFDFDSYMSQISEHSFRSILVPVDPACARAMVSYYQQRYNGRHGALSHGDIGRLETLRGTVANVMTRDLSGGPVFCRMTNRSPKDGEPRDLGKLEHLYKQELSKLDQQQKAHQKSSEEGQKEVWDQANLQMVAASAAQQHMLCCRNADQVMDLLLSSERVFVDTLLALDCASDPNDEWSTCLILREWNEGVRGDWEFRAFVHDGHLTAISQYNHYCFFPDLLKVDKKRLKSEIVEYWEAVRDSISATSYIIDIAKLSDGTWKIIELNPYATTTGSALFDWETDRTVLSSSCLDSELRIRQDLYPGLEDYVQEVMLAMVSPVRGENKPTHSGPWDNFLTVSSNDDQDTENMPPRRAPFVCKVHCTIQ